MTKKQQTTLSALFNEMADKYVSLGDAIDLRNAEYAENFSFAENLFINAAVKPASVLKGVFTKRSEYTKFMTETELLVTREEFPMRPKNQVVSRNCFVSMMKDAYGEKFDTPIAADSLDARMVSYSVNAWNKCEDKTAQVKSGAYVTMANRF
jgi:hypothetical protein